MEKPLAVDHRADIYSLGVVFYELLTGELPLGRFPPPSRRVQVDVRLDEVVLRALERDPTCRYQHVSEVKAAVDGLAQAPAAGQPAPVKNSLAADLAALVGVALSLALLGLCTWWLKSAYLVVGVPLLAYFAQGVPWGGTAKVYAGLVLAVGGLIVFVLAGQAVDFQPVWLFIAAASMAWVSVMGLFGGGGWGGQPKAEESEEGTGELPGLSAPEREILRVLKRFSWEGGLHLAPELPKEGLHNARQRNELPPEERVLALLDFTGDEDDASQSLLFCSSGISFHVKKGDGVPRTITHAIPYADFGRRSFVNHGKSVYLGDGVSLTPPEESEVSCEAICNMLNALKQANVQGQGRM
jgi:hypothetical protein